MTKPKLHSLDKLNLFLGLVGLVSVIVALATNVWIVALVLAVSYLALLVVVAVHDRSVPWSAWRIIIAVGIVGAVVGLQSLPSRTWEADVDTQGDWRWHVEAGKELNYYPVTDDPESGREIASLVERIYALTVSCWESGKLTTKDGSISAADVDWVLVSGGALDSLWVPYVAINSRNPGVARKLPRCNSWKGRRWPF
ncbi:hypothetical protein AB0L64_40680 [Kribbella sp. NPDC051936]|uniref:hypothetical protein n=1 Tax=Kribbella sp. NPDC051936 TaxID=3154946 RepID=UPI00344684A6